MKRLGQNGTSAAVCGIALCCVVSLSGCVSSFGWPTRLGSTASREAEIETQLSLARLSERHGQNDQARKIYQAVLNKSPNNQLAHHRLGVMAARESRASEAESHFHKATEVAPPTVELLNDMGYHYYLQDRLAEAEHSFREAIEVDPKSKLAHNNLGMVLGELGRNEESLREFRHAVSEAEAHSNLAYARSQAGDLRTAEQQFHRALALDETLRPTAEALVDLAEMRSSLENAQAARAQLADHGASQREIALTSAELPAANRRAAPRRRTASAPTRAFGREASPRPQTAAATPATPREPQAPKAIDWRNPIASAAAAAAAVPTPTPTHPDSAAEKPQNAYAHLPAAFRQPHVAVTGTLSSQRPKRGPSPASARRSLAHASRDDQKTQHAASAEGKLQPSSGTPLVQRALRNVRQTLAASPMNAPPTSAQKAGSREEQRMRGNPMAKAAPGNEMKRPPATPRQRKVSISLSDDSGTDRQGAVAAAKRPAAATKRSDFAPASQTNSQKRPSSTDRIPTLSRRPVNQRVSWQADSGIRPPEVAPPGMPKTSPPEKASQKTSSRAALSHRRHQNPWQQPTWSAQTADGETPDTTSSITTGILSPPAKSIENPYAAMPQR